VSPIEHSSNNIVMKAPEDMPDCIDLLATRLEVDGYHVIQSYWQPSEHELKLLAAGKPVMLSIFGRSMSPVWITVPE
jgi:hypothetical protein